MRIERALGQTALRAPHLVDEDEERVRLGEVGGDLAERLRHESRLQCHVVVAHLALQLGTRHERRHAINHDHVHSARAHERVDDLQGAEADVSRVIARACVGLWAAEHL